MGLPQLASCCFILDLKTGNIVMGSFNAVLSFTLFIIMIVVTCTLEPLKDKSTDINAQAEYTGLYAMSVILILMFLAKFCFDIFFVYGAIMEKAGIIRAYFVMWMVFFMLSMFTFFLNAPHYNPGTICMEVFYICLNVYAILLVNSFYRQLNTREEV